MTNLIRDFHRHNYRETGILAMPARYPKLDEEMWLVVSRPGKCRTPWYMLTNEPIANADDAWRGGLGLCTVGCGITHHRALAVRGRMRQRRTSGNGLSHVASRQPEDGSTF